MEPTPAPGAQNSKLTKKVLVRNTSALGDVVSSIGLIKLIGQTYGDVDLLTLNAFKGLDSGEKHFKVVDDEHARKTKYDLYIDLTSSSQSRREVGKFKSLTKIGRAESLTYQMKMWGSYQKTVAKHPFKHLVLDYAPVLKALPELWKSWEVSFQELEIFYNNQQQKFKTLPETFRRHKGMYAELKCFVEISRWRMFLPNLGYSKNVELPEALSHISPKSYGVLHVGAGNAKRVLPLDLSKHLLSEMLKRYAQVVLIGVEESLVAPLLQIPEFKSRVLYAPLNLPQLKKVIAESNEMMGPDSGPLHLASALGVKCVGIFGPNIPLRSGPLQSQVQLLEMDLECRPCDQNKLCPYNVKCMNDLNVKPFFQKRILPDQPKIYG